MPAFRSLEVWTDVEGNFGQRVAVLPDGLRIDPVYDITGDESLTVSLPRTSPFYSVLQEKQALRLVRRTAAGVERVEEWRITERSDSSGAGDPPAEIIARSLMLELGDAIISTVLSDGSTSYQFGFVDLTIAQVIDTYCLPALAAVGKSWFFRGTIDVATTFSGEYDRMSVLSLLRTIAEMPQFLLEPHLRRNGTVGQYIDMLSEIGAGTSMVRVETRKNLESMTRSRSTAEQTTRVRPQGPDTGGGVRVGIEAARWVVTNIDVPSQRLTLADELGRFPSIQFAAQFDNWYLFRERTGRTFQINTTVPATQEVSIGDLSTFAVGERVSFRSSESLTNTLNWRDNSGYGIVSPLLYVTGVSGGGPLRVAIADSYNGSGGIIPANDEMVDWAANFFSAIYVGVSKVTGVNAPGQYYQIDLAENLSGVSVGDLVFADIDTSTTPHYSSHQPYAQVGTVTAVDNVLKRVTVANRYDAAAAVIVATIAVTLTFRVYRPVIGRLIRRSYAASNEIELASVAGIAALQLLEVRQTCGGVLPTALDAPQARDTYGVVDRFIDRDAIRGETTLNPNPFMRAWSGISSVPPDGWTSTALGITRIANPLYTKYGGYAARVAFPGSFFTDKFRVWRVGRGGRARISIRMRITFEALNSDAQMQLLVSNISVYSMFSIGYAIGYTGPFPPSAANQYAEGVTHDISVTGIDVSALPSWAQLKVELRGNGTGNCIGVVDVIQVTQTSYDPGAYIEASAACELWADGNRHLVDFSGPVTEYAGKLRDFERVDGTPWPDDEIVLGGKLDVRDSTLGIAQALRVVRYAPKVLAPDDSDVILSTRRKPLTRILSEAF